MPIRRSPKGSPLFRRWSGRRSYDDEELPASQAADGGVDIAAGSCCIRAVSARSATVSVSHTICGLFRPPGMADGVVLPRPCGQSQRLCKI